MVSSIPVRVTQEGTLSPQMEILKGTLDLMVLQTLAGLGSVHGYGIARRIEQVSGDTILLNQGTIYASLVRLQQRGLIRSEWGVSDNNRKAKFYSLTKRGTRQLAAAAENWEQVSTVMERFFAGPKGPASEGSL
jgi:PadR family transcriptional regulator PadR